MSVINWFECRLALNPLKTNIHEKKKNFNLYIIFPSKTRALRWFKRKYFNFVVNVYYLLIFRQSSVDDHETKNVYF